MGPAELSLMLPIVAVIFGTGTVMVKGALRTFERLQMARMQANQSKTGLSDDAVLKLQQEIALLRDTTTQHAISLQHSVERLEQRVEFLERKTSIEVKLDSALAQETNTEPRQQIAGRF